MPKYLYEKEMPISLSRSRKLRKYASMYKSYSRKTEQSKISKSPRRDRKTPSQVRKTESDVRKPKKKTLNSYQKFVQAESKKAEYLKLSGKERLSAIAKKWKKIH